MSYNYAIDAVARSTGSSSLNMFATAPAGVEQKVLPGTTTAAVSIPNNLSTSLAAYIPVGSNGIYVIDCDCPSNGNYSVTSTGSIVKNASTTVAVGFNATAVGQGATAPLGVSYLNSSDGSGVFLFQNSGAALVFNITVTKIASF